MSIRNCTTLLLSVSALLFLFACGGSGTPKGAPPPSGAFGPGNLKGTYVFSVSGTDTGNVPFAIVGTLSADGSGGISSGTLDINDFQTGTLPASALNAGSSYSVGQDGRGKATLKTSTPFGTITLDFVLADSSHGFVTEFDGNASGSGTLELQTANSLAGPYAFSFAGSDFNGLPFATAGAFTLSSSAASGVEDFNDANIATNQVLSGTVVLGPSGNPATTFNGITYDVFAINANHLKFIEMDGNGTLSGDAFAQGTGVPTGPLAFTLAGFFPFSTISPVFVAAGGFIVTDGGGNITLSSSEDVNDNGAPSNQPLSFSGTYTDTGSGRFTLNLSSFFGGSQYAAYPIAGGSGNGLLLLEIDNTGVMSGSASAQTTTSFAASQGYGMNFTGVNLNVGVEVDDIAEFVANSSGATVTGLADENIAPSSFPLLAQPLIGTYVSPDANGRGTISATTGGTENGGFGITFYTVDGSTFPFIENDPNGQIAVGTFELQNASSTPSAARSGVFITRPVARGQFARRQKK